MASPQDKKKANADKVALLEEYKLVVEKADRINARRSNVNKFYITLLTALLSILVLVS